MAFFLGRLPPNPRYTYGYGRAEDLAGIAIVVMIAASSALAANEAVTRLLHPHRVTDLIAVAAAALAGFAGNELAARYRIRTGRKIGSAALVADGLHARTDGFTSLAVLLGADGAALGWDWADPAVGLLITVAILAVLRQAAREIYQRLMDAVDPALTGQAESTLRDTPGVLGVGQVRQRPYDGHGRHRPGALLTGRSNTGVPVPGDVPPAVATAGTASICCPGPTARCVHYRPAREALFRNKRTPCKFAMDETRAALRPSTPPRKRPSPSGAPERGSCRSFSHLLSCPGWH